MPGGWRFKSEVLSNFPWPTFLLKCCSTFFWPERTRFRSLPAGWVREGIFLLRGRPKFRRSLRRSMKDSRVR
jgi:hypothetical protein